MPILYCLTAIFIAWIWVDYFRLIDLFDREKLIYIIMIFCMGASSVTFIFGIHALLMDHIPFDLNGEFFNDFLYCIFGIGLPEEIAKFLPFLIFYKLFKSTINEPIDYLIYISVSALGFSAAENVMYFIEHGPDIISGRSILSTVTHMFCSALVAYGIIRYKYFYQKKKFVVILFYLLLASMSHGFYDFWLIYEEGNGFGWIITLFYFLFTVSFFATILNNALNQSSYFSYKKVIDPFKVSSRMLLYYLAIFVIQFLFLTWQSGILSAWGHAISSIYLTGFVVMITVLRLSRFKLIKGRWNPIKPELPFGLIPNIIGPETKSFFKIGIKGESYNETQINSYYDDYCTLSPISSRNSFLEETRLAFVEKKLFLKDDATYYLLKVFLDDEKGKFIQLLIKPKTSGTMLFKNRYPLVAVLGYDNQDLQKSDLSMADFEFREWAYLKPQQHFR